MAFQKEKVAALCLKQDDTMKRKPIDYPALIDAGREAIRHIYIPPRLLKREKEINNDEGN